MIRSILAAAGASVLLGASMAIAQDFTALYADMLEDPPAFSEESGGFIWDPEFDASGYYLPAEGLQAGEWIISHLFLPMPDELTRWSTDGADPETVPVWLEVYNAGTEWTENELGQRYPLDSRRIRASSIMIEKARFDFRAEDETLGEITLAGFFHPDRLHRLPDAPSPDPALIGAADLGEVRVWSADFIHWLGD
ncbi:MAG: hypothetical protein AAFX09_05365 [Pseudomonadota bacterium]